MRSVPNRRHAICACDTTESHTCDCATVGSQHGHCSKGPIHKAGNWPWIGCRCVNNAKAALPSTDRQLLLLGSGFPCHCSCAKSRRVGLMVSMPAVEACQIMRCHPNLGLMFLMEGAAAGSSFHHHFHHQEYGNCALVPTSAVGVACRLPANQRKWSGHSLR